MISKIHNIRAIGKFEDFSPSEPLEMGKLTLIYSDNGRGKSTLADIFRALALGDANLLVGRKTLRCNIDQLVKFELDTGLELTFANHQWHGQSCKLQVFDDVYISVNVYAGTSVGTDHKRNIAQIIIGDIAVRAQEKEDNLKMGQDQLKQQIENLEAEIREQIHSSDGKSAGKIPVNEFVALENVPDINKAVEQQETLVKQLENSDELLIADTFSELVLPGLPISELKELLGKSLVQIEKIAEQQVREHLSHYHSGRVEDWIERGTQFVAERNDSCPFCGQELSGSNLIQHYRAYFNKEYIKLKEDIASFANEHLVFDNAVNEMHLNLIKNNSAFQFWHERNPELQLKDLSHSEVKEALDFVVSKLRELLNNKSNSPLDRLQLNETSTQAINQWSAVKQKVERYNKVVILTNKNIGELRETVLSADLEQEKSELVRLRNIQLRYSSNVTELCDLYTQAKHELQALEQQISETREEIDKSIDKLFAKYKDKVNEYLVYLGAEFTIGDFDRTRDRTSVRIRKYGLIISGEMVDVGKPDASIDKASFKNTVSAGDRRTLAFAYFLAQLESLPNLDDQVVIFDDPMTSLDTNRRTKTIAAINKFCNKANQAIIMSHDAFFLHEFWNSYNRKRNQCISKINIIAGPGENKPSTLAADWDIEAAVRNQEAKDYKRILDFSERRSAETDMADIARCARMLLEQRCRTLYLDVCQNSNAFGSFMECVAQTRPTPEFCEFQKKVSDVLSFCNPNLHSHPIHRPNPNETETRDFCNTVLNLLGRL